MTKAEIIEALARERRVEAMVMNVAHFHLTQDLKDLCQMVYMVLLEYDEERLQDLWEKGQINFFLARIILNQYKSTSSPFYVTFRRFRSMIDESVLLGTSGCDIRQGDILETFKVLKNEE